MRKDRRIKVSKMIEYIVVETDKSYVDVSEVFRKLRLEFRKIENELESNPFVEIRIGVKARSSKVERFLMFKLAGVYGSKLGVETIGRVPEEQVLTKIRV